MNPDLEGSAKALAGKTIVLPGDKLSQRDKEILAGMAQGKGKGYRIYPVGWGTVRHGAGQGQGLPHRPGRVGGTDLRYHICLVWGGGLVSDTASTR